MKTGVIVMLAVTILTELARAQVVNLNVGVDTSIASYGTVYRLWYDYLHSRPDSVYDNPYWNRSEKKRYKSFDLLNSQGFLYPSLYGLKLDAQVLSITRESAGFDIRTMFYRYDEKEKLLHVIAIAHVFAKTRDGQFRLFNYLPLATRNWPSSKIENITYHYPPGYAFDPAGARTLVSFQDSLITLFELRPKPIDFYVTRSFDEYQKAVGFDFMLSMGSQVGIRGNNDSKNGIIYSGGGGEYYPHEIVGIYLGPLFPNANGWLTAGLEAVYGGHFGHPLNYHYKRVDRYLKQHPSIDLDDFLRDFSTLDEKTSPVYVIGGLFCQLALEKGGIKELKKFLRMNTKTDEDLYEAIAKEFGVPKSRLNNFIRKQIEERANENVRPQGD